MVTQKSSLFKGQGSRGQAPHENSAEAIAVAEPKHMWKSPGIDEQKTRGRALRS